MLVAELLDDPELALDVRVRGNVERPIRWVHTIEIDVPSRFLRGGEVVLTAGVWRTTGLTAAEFLADLAAADVAAVGFGLVPPEPVVPEEFVEAARRHGLTCFVVPVSVPFLHIAETFVSAKRAEWERPLRRHLAQQDEIVAALRVRRGVEAVLDTLTGKLGAPVAVRAAGGLVTGTQPQSRHPLPLIGEGLADAELLLPRPVEELDVVEHAAVVQAMPFIALEIERSRAVRATELRYAWELFEWVASGAAGAETVRTRLSSLGLPAEGPLAALVVRTEEPAAHSARLGEFLGTDGIAVQRGEEVVAFARVRGTAAELARSAHAEFDPAVVHLGVGKPATAEELRISLLQASRAAEAASSRSAAGWMTHDQLSSPAMLLEAQDPDLLGATARALLGPVLENDERRGGDLLASLRVFLDEGGRWQEAAQRLHVHINTLRHRISRVEELTGRSVARTSDRVDLYLALRALRRS
ncbi:helix-turn-helix domain-containing protein [Salinifilum aidingensis]